jgi:hypothetical protein
MSSSRTTFRRLLIATGVALVVVMSASGQESRLRRGRSIQFAEPRSDVVKSNVNQLGANKTTLNSLEQDLRKPFEWLNPGENLADRFTGAAAPRALPSPTRARQMKDLLEKRNEWIFLEPEDYFAGGLNAEENSHLPEYGLNGEEKKKKTAVERYYERLDSMRAELQAATNQVAGSDPLNPRPKREGEEEQKELVLGGQPGPLSSGLGDMEQTVKSLSAVDPSAFGTIVSEPGVTRSFADVFGFGKKEPAESAQEKSRAMETRIQEFKQLLETRSLTPSSPGLAGYNPLVSSPLTAPPAVPSAGLDGFNSDTARGFSSLLSPSPVSQTTLSGLPTAAANIGSPSWQTTLPAPEQPRMTLPAPAFNIPQRKF